MGILSWIVIGGLAGLAARFVTKRHLGLIVTIIVGIIGAVVGGWVLTNVTNGPGLTGVFSQELPGRVRRSRRADLRLQSHLGPRPALRRDGPS